MSYFVDAENRDPMTLVPGARTRTFWGENILLSLVEIDANSEVPTHTHPHEQAGMLVQGELEMGVAGDGRGWRSQASEAWRHVHHTRRRGTLRQVRRCSGSGFGHL